LNNLFDYLKSRSKSSVAKNFFALSILQVANFIFPMITLPYVTRIFGPEIYGLLNFATSFLVYFSLIVNYGFDLSASREISQNRNNWSKVEEIFNNVLFSKLFLFFIASIFFLVSLFAIQKIEEYKALYLIMYFGSIFNIFFPTWFFQGIEKLNITAIFTFIVKLIFTGLIFLLIKSKDDYLLYPLTTIIGQIIVSIISLILITKRFNIKLKMPLTFLAIYNTLKEGSKIFLTTVIINLYTTTNLVLLGFLATDYDVGIFSAAQKIIIIIISLITGPIGQSLYPHIGYTLSKNYQNGIQKIYESFLIVVIITIVPAIIIFIFPSIIINILYGHQFNDAIITLRILAFLPLIIGISNIFGVQGLLNLKKDKEVILITSIGALVGLGINFYLIPVYKYNGAALSWLLTEIVITILMIIVFIKNTNFKQDIKIFQRNI